jgi:hypothetical protein
VLRHLQARAEKQSSTLATLDQRLQVQGPALTQSLATQMEQNGRALRRWLLVTTCLSAQSLRGVVAIVTYLLPR